MTRVLTFFPLFFFAASPALAQDMPLSQILIDGQGWKKGEANATKPRSDGPTWCR